MVAYTYLLEVKKNIHLQEQYYRSNIIPSMYTYHNLHVTNQNDTLQCYYKYYYYKFLITVIVLIKLKHLLLYFTLYHM